MDPDGGEGMTKENLVVDVKSFGSCIVEDVEVRLQSNDNHWLTMGCHWLTLRRHWLTQVSSHISVCDCSAGNYVKSSLESSASRQLVSTDSGSLLKTSCNVTPPLPTLDSSLYESPVFTHDELDDDFEPMPSCKLF